MIGELKGKTRLMLRRATDEDDPVIGMPIGKVWNEELEKRLRGGKLNIQRKELEKQ